ncbi:MAG: hypothetical protein R3Y67_02200 [Eubacteriales bacterium]
MQTEEYKKLARCRNGVETIPAVLRKRYNIDTMPVRGLIKCRQYFGFKIAALNTRKLLKYILSIDSCTLKVSNAQKCALKILLLNAIYAFIFKKLFGR